MSIHIGLSQVVIENKYVYCNNISGNYTRIALEAGIYMHIWKPQEIGIKKAYELILPLEKALTLLKEQPEKFIKSFYDLEDGIKEFPWFINFLESYLNACKLYPAADIDKPE